MADRKCYECSEPSPFGYDLCDACNVAVETGWPVSLGLAIRSFARRCEVEGLVATSLRAMGCAGAFCDPKDCAAAAVRRLAALAIEGAGR